jgi:hypothetical protein
MSNPYANADYYRDETLTEKKIGKDFKDCMFEWGFPTDQFTPKNDSTEYDIQYSFDGKGVAGRLKKGVDALAGGDAYNYGKSRHRKIYFRIAPDEYVEGHNLVPFRLWVNRSPTGVGE